VDIFGVPVRAVKSGIAVATVRHPG